MGGELHEVIQLLIQYLLERLHCNFKIFVNEDVPQSRHRRDPIGELSWQYAYLRQRKNTRSVTIGQSPATRRNQVTCNIEHGLNAGLQAPFQSPPRAVIGDEMLEGLISELLEQRDGFKQV